MLVLLTEILTYTDIRQLHQLAETYKCECDIHSKNQLIQAILNSMKKESVMHLQLEELSSETLHFLILIIFDPRNTFTAEDLQAKAKLAACSDDELLKEYGSLPAMALRNGWVLKTTDNRFQATFHCPDDLRKKLRELTVRRFRINTTLQDAPEISRYEQYALADDIYVFLDYIKNNPVPLTMDGVIYRRVQQQLLQRFAVAEDVIHKGGWRFGYGKHFGDYPDRFSLLYDFCWYHNLIVEDLRSGLQLTTKGETLLEKREIMGTAKKLISFWQRWYKKPLPNIAALARFSASLCKGCWVEESSLNKELACFVKPFYYDSPENIIHFRLLKMMVHLGLLQKGEGGVACYALSPIGERWLRGGEP